MMLLLLLALATLMPGRAYRGASAYAYVIEKAPAPTAAPEKGEKGGEEAAKEEGKE